MPDFPANVEFIFHDETGKGKDWQTQSHYAQKRIAFLACRKTERSFVQVGARLPVRSVG